MLFCLFCFWWRKNGGWFSGSGTCSGNVKARCSKRGELKHLGSQRCLSRRRVDSNKAMCQFLRHKVPVFVLQLCSTVRLSLSATLHPAQGQETLRVRPLSSLRLVGDSHACRLFKIQLKMEIQTPSHK